MSKRGRPPGSSFSPAIAEEVLGYLADGKGLRWIANQPGCPSPGTIQDWARDGNGPLGEDFTKRYARALELGIDLIVEDTMIMADSATAETAQAVRIAVDTRKWFAEKKQPKRYGNKLELSGDAESPLVVTDLRKLSDAELATLAELAEKAK